MWAGDAGCWLLSVHGDCLGDVGAASSEGHCHKGEQGTRKEEGTHGEW